MACNSCAGNCNHCSGCARDLVLTQKEVDMLEKLGQIPFLPVARKVDSMTPIYLEEGNVEENSLVLQCLEKKGLICLDFDKPLRGFCDAAYSAYPLVGSMALTARGQSVLELLQVQGITEEA